MAAVDEVIAKLEALEQERGADAALVAAMDELCGIDAGMLGGQCLPKAELATATVRLSEYARAAFARFVSVDRKAARRCLGDLPAFRRPRSFDLSEWQTTLDVAPDRTAFLNGEQSAADAWLDAKLAGLGLRRDTPPPAGLDALFGAPLPSNFAGAWRRALELPTEQHDDIAWLDTLEQVVVLARFVASEELPMRDRDITGPDELPPFVPFAEGAEEAVLFVDLTRPDGAGDFAVCRFFHDSGDESAVVADSTGRWLRSS